MGKRKKLAAEARKEAKKTMYMARLVDNPTSHVRPELWRT